MGGPWLAQKTTLALIFFLVFLGRAESISQIVWQKRLILEPEPFFYIKMLEPELKLVTLLFVASSA